MRTIQMYEDLYYALIQLQGDEQGFAGLLSTGADSYCRMQDAILGLLGELRHIRMVKKLHFAGGKRRNYITTHKDDHVSKAFMQMRPCKGDYLSNTLTEIRHPTDTMFDNHVLRVIDFDRISALTLVGEDRIIGFSSRVDIRTIRHLGCVDLLLHTPPIYADISVGLCIPSADKLSAMIAAQPRHRFRDAFFDVLSSAVIVDHECLLDAFRAFSDEHRW